MTQTTYKNAGVDIDAGNALVERIKPLAAATKRSGLMGGLGGFGALFDLKAAGYHDPILISGTDGVGTKLKLAHATGKHDTIGIDLVAMCVNDLIVQGAEPLFFLDYFATGKLSVAVGEAVVKGIAHGCKEAGCALIGGETAEMPSMYADGEYDLAGFAVGAAEREKLLPLDVAEGDVVLGLASSGVHSNGFSLVRHVVEKAGLNYASPCPFAPGHTLGEALLTPTHLYINSLLPLIKQADSPIKALAHITGGGLLENIPRVLPSALGVRLNKGSWDMPPVFNWLQQAGNIAETEMHRTFNCGVGMIAITAAKDANHTMQALAEAGEKGWVIGEVVKRAGEAVVI